MKKGNIIRIIAVQVVCVLLLCSSLACVRAEEGEPDVSTENETAQTCTVSLDLCSGSGASEICSVSAGSTVPRPQDPETEKPVSDNNMGIDSVSERAEEPAAPEPAFPADEPEEEAVAAETESSEQLLNDTAGEKSSRRSPVIRYRTHVQNIGWQPYVSNGGLAGTTGQSLRLEGINIQLSDLPCTGGITYRTHVQNIGWQDWVSDGAMAGTTGQSLRLEAIQIRLTGESAEKYDLWYQTHIQNFGWTGWAKNGEMCGSAGYAYRLEGIRILILEKGSAAPGSTAAIFWENGYGVKNSADHEKGTLVAYCTHVQNIGWQNEVMDGAAAGTEGKSLRLEGIRIRLTDAPYPGGIRYRTHIQNVGWQDWRADGDLSGTTGRSLRLEAIQIELTGSVADTYDVYYRVHTETFGWLPWAKNGQQTGTTGFSKRLESIEIILMPKDRIFQAYDKNAVVLKTNTVQRHIFLGDSRTCCIVNAIYGTYLAGNGASADQWFGNDYFACKWGGHLVDGNYYFVDSVIRAMQDNTNVYVLMGRNDIGSPQSQFAGLYNNALQRLAAAAAGKTNTRVFFVTCGPDQGSPVTQFAEFNNAVNCTGVQKLDPWSSLGTLTYQTNIYGDFHYSDETSAALYNWLKSAAAR